MAGSNIKLRDRIVSGVLALLIPILGLNIGSSFNSAEAVSYNDESIIATTSPCNGFSFAVSGIIIPPIVFSSAGAGRIRTLSANGLMFIIFLFYMLYICYNGNFALNKR